MYSVLTTSVEAIVVGTAVEYIMLVASVWQCKQCTSARQSKRANVRKRLKIKNFQNAQAPQILARRDRATCSSFGLHALVRERTP